MLNPSDPQPPGRMESLLAFPNPNSGNFDASFYLGVGKKATLTVTDMVGKQLYRRQLTGQGMHREKVNLPVKVAGILLLQLVKEDKTLTHKIKLTR